MRSTHGLTPKMLEESQASPVAASSSLSCFVTTEAALDRVADAAESATFASQITHGHYKRNTEPHKQRSSAQTPLSSRTVASMASTSSSALDVDFESEFEQDFDVPQHQNSSALELMTPAFSASVSMSGMSLASSLDDSPTKSYSHAFPPEDMAIPQMGTASAEVASLLGPQLVMPSLALPCRRPYTEIGKSLGKLKILVAGRPGIGKKSLLESIARSCEHIVHVDPAVTTMNGNIEIFASTRPRPRWRMTKIGGMNIGKRHDHVSDELLDRNICFVVSAAPKHDSYTNILPETQYVESQLACLRDKFVDDADLEALISSGSVPVVDAMLYLLPYTGLTQTDIEVLRSLQDKTNIIPLLAKADTLDSEEILAAKQHIRRQMREHGLRCFSFQNSSDDEVSDLSGFADVFAVSSAPGSDPSVLDASILMDSGYVQPLHDTDLARLTDIIFGMDGCPLLRHFAALKCLRWRSQVAPIPPLHMTLARRDPLHHAISPVLTANPFSQQKFWDYVEVSNWAQCLRRSLEAERVARITFEKAMLDICQKKVSGDLIRRGGKAQKNKPFPEPNLQHQDPLGLLGFGSQLKRNGGLAAELVSSVGIIGCLVSWAGEWSWP